MKKILLLCLGLLQIASVDAMRRAAMSGYVSDAQKLKVIRAHIAEAQKAVDNNDFAALDDCMKFFQDKANLDAVNPAQKAMMAQAVTRFESHWTALKPADFTEKETKAGTKIGSLGAKWKLNKLKKEEAAKQEAAAIKLQSYARMLVAKKAKDKMREHFGKMLQLGVSEEGLQEGDIQDWCQEFDLLKPSTNELYSIMQAVRACFTACDEETVSACKDLAAYQTNESQERRFYREWLNLYLLPWAQTSKGMSEELCAPVAGAPINDDADGGEDAFGGGEDFGGGEAADDGGDLVETDSLAVAKLKIKRLVVKGAARSDVFDAVDLYQAQHSYPELNSIQVALDTKDPIITQAMVDVAQAL